jgi:ABC-type branched-subunit amino acid transport system substrate-binding protein
MCMTQNEFDNCLQNLNKQPKEVLKLFLNGQNDVEIAIEIAKKVNSKPIKPNTVKSHISYICNKFGLINEGNSGYDHRDELIDLFIRYKGKWVANCVRDRLGYPKWEDPDSNRHIKRTGSNFYLEQTRNCRDEKQVIKLLKQAVKGDCSDPYAQIYLNNAKARLQGNPLKIGVVVAKAGNDFHEFASIQVLRGIADAQTSFNQSNGKDGHLLEIDIRNDGNYESDAEAVAQEFVNDSNIRAVLGHHSSEATKVALRIYEEKSVALISPTSTSSQLKSKTLFRTIGSTKAVARKYVQYIKEHLNLDKIAVFCHEDNEFSQTLMDDFKTAFSVRGGQIIQIFDVHDPYLDIEGSINEIRTESKAALVISSIETNTVAIAIARENSNLPQSKKLQLLFTTSLPEIPMLEKGGEALEGAVLVGPCLAEDSDYMQQARIRWGQQEINWRVATSYDATQALIEAIRLSEVPTREEILNNLEGLNLSIEQTSGFGLKWSESDYHSNTAREYCIAQIRNNRFEVIF